MAINLDVELPENIALQVDDGSGSIEIENIGGPVTVDDGSGSMSIKDIQGNRYSFVAYNSNWFGQKVSVSNAYF